MSLGFYLQAGVDRYLGLSSDASAQAHRVDILPRRDDAFGRVLSLGPGGAVAGTNDRGVAIISTSPTSRMKAVGLDTKPEDWVSSALASSTTAEEARDAVIAAASACGRSAAEPSSRLSAGKSFLLLGADGAYLVETAGTRWAWRQAEVTEVIGDSFAIANDYKRLDPDTRKSIAPVNDRMACLDEADAGRLGEKDSWKAYIGDRRSVRKADSRKRALETLVEAAGRTGNIASVFALLRAHGIADPARPSTHWDVCRHGGFFSPRASSAMVFADGPGGFGCCVWFTGAPYACANLFKPVTLAGEFEALWDGYDYGQPAAEPFAYWNERMQALKALARKPYASAPSTADLAAAQDTILAAAAAFSAGKLDAGMARSRIGEAVKAWDGRTAGS